MRNKKVIGRTNIGAVVLCSLVLIGCHPYSEITRINLPEAPKAIGPYSQAVKTGNLIFCSGQLGISPKTGELVGPDIESQTRQAILNLKTILESGGSDLSQVTKVTVFLSDMENYGTVNKIYGEYFDHVRPARSTVQIAKLPRNGLIEIECIAVAR
ncbi:RidA family protein [Chryseobacterium sp.]|uniref:RidA family protein n=1 Tax=Chryseobacterium sp. TaxID=1871047 RepID=UPI0033429F8B